MSIAENKAQIDFERLLIELKSRGLEAEITRKNHLEDGLTAYSILLTDKNGRKHIRIDEIWEKQLGIKKLTVWSVIGCNCNSNRLNKLQLKWLNTQWHTTYQDSPFKIAETDKGFIIFGTCLSVKNLDKEGVRAILCSRIYQLFEESPFAENLFKKLPDLK